MKINHVVFVFISLSLLVIGFFSIDINRQVDEEMNDVLGEKVIRYVEGNIKEMVSKPQDFNNFYLLFDHHNLNSKNMEQLFTFFNDNQYEYRIYEIYPYVNPLFGERLVNVEKISFNSNNLLNIINSFYLGYTKELKSYNLYEEIERNTVRGIPIRMIKINTSNKAMYDFLRTNNNVKYSISKNGFFKKI